MHIVKFKILFVEDEVDLQEIINLTLNEFNDIDYEIVESGEKALSSLQRDKFDVIVTDHYLPGIQGVDLLIKVKDEYPSMKRFLLTGSIENEVYKKAREKANPQYIFEKPLVLEEIIIKIQEFMNN